MGHSLRLSIASGHSSMQLPLSVAVDVLTPSCELLAMYDGGVLWIAKLLQLEVILETTRIRIQSGNCYLEARLSYKRNLTGVDA